MTGEPEVNVLPLHVWLQERTCCSNVSQQKAGILTNEQAVNLSLGLFLWVRAYV